MKKEFIVNCLNKLKDLHFKRLQVYAVGIDLLNFESCDDLLIEAIAMLFEDYNENGKLIIDDIYWWLYENVKKEIAIDKKIYNVAKTEDFVDWLEDWYKKNVGKNSDVEFKRKTNKK